MQCTRIPCPSCRCCIVWLCPFCPAAELRRTVEEHNAEHPDRPVKIWPAANVDEGQVCTFACTQIPAMKRVEERKDLFYWSDWMMDLPVVAITRCGALLLAANRICLVAASRPLHRCAAPSVLPLTAPHCHPRCHCYAVPAAAALPGIFAGVCRVSQARASGTGAFSDVVCNAHGFGGWCRLVVSLVGCGEDIKRQQGTLVSPQKPVCCGCVNWFVVFRPRKSKQSAPFGRILEALTGKPASLTSAQRSGGMRAALLAVVLSALQTAYVAHLLLVPANGTELLGSPDQRRC